MQNGLGTMSSGGSWSPPRTNAVKGPTLLDETRGEIEGATKDVQELAARVATFANETLGAVPMGSGGNLLSAENIEIPDRASQLRRALAALRGSVNELREHVNRLSQI